MAATEEIILKLKVESGGAITNIDQAKKRLKDLRVVAEEANDPAIVEQASAEYGKLDKTVKEFNKSLRQVKANANTIEGLRQEVSRLNEQWKQTEIGTKEFKDLEGQLRGATDRLKAFEAAVGDNRRNVGDYKSAVVTLEKELSDLRRQEDLLIKKQQELVASGKAEVQQLDAIEKEQKQVKASINQTTFAVDSLNKKLEETGKEIVDGVGNKLTGFGNQMVDQFKRVGLAIAAAFTLDKIADFTKEAFNLSLQAEGIRFAFDRLNAPGLLNNLRAATKGMVSDFELMKVAVRANNFQIPLEQLGTLLEFAQKRALQTGESVDYLVDSIVTGIGRKSTLILDNLGISATAIKEKFEGISLETISTGEFVKKFGELAQAELGKMGDQAEGASVKIGQMSTAFENLKLSFGDLIKGVSSTDFFKDLQDGISQTINGIALDIQAASKDISREQLEAIKFMEASLSKAREQDAKETTENLQLGLNASKEIYEDYFHRIASAQSAFDVLGNESSKHLLNELKIKKDLYGQYVKGLEQLINQRIEAERSASDEVIEIANKEAKAKTDALKGISAPSVGGEGLEEGASEFTPLEGAFMDEELKAITTLLTAKTDADDAYTRNLQESIKERGKAEQEGVEASKEAERKRQEIMSASIEIISTATNAIFDIQRNNIQEQFSAQEEGLKKQLESGAITQEKFDKLTEELRKKEGQQQQRIAINQAIINGALGVTRELSTKGIPAGLATAAILAAQTAAQIAVIRSQKFAKGGLVYGKSHAEGGEKFAVGGRVAELEGGEAVINKRSTSMFKPVLSAINSFNGYGKKFANGGITMPNNISAPNLGMSSMVGAIRDLQVKAELSIIDFKRVESKLNIIETASRL